MEGGNELLQCLDEKIASGHSMIERLKLMDKIDGIDKLIRRIQQEIKFFEKVQCMGNLKKEHLQSSNLTHLDAMVARLSCAKDPTSVMRPFKYQKLRLEVDIVCNSGASWVKVIARNAKALTLISLGHGEYGQKSILDQANSYLMCSKCHLYHYRPPDVIFHFAYGIEVPLALQLEQMGIIVEGDRLDTGENNLNSQYNVSEAATLCKDLTKACDIAMPQVTGQRRRNQPYWWSEEIASLRREAIKCRRAYTRSRPRRDPSNTAQCLDRMRQARQALRSAIRIAKAKAWDELLAIVILIIVFFFYFLEVEQDELDSSKESSNNSKNDSNVSLRSLNTSVQSTEVRLLNLDVSSLLAYVTNMSNGYNNFVYREPLLTQQAEMERKRPIKSILENLFQDKELVICQTAYKNFMNIIHFIGGPKETQRALELLKKVRIVDDVTTGRIMELRLGGKIKDRSRLIFATGESMKSITVSANEGFVRAARMQGIECTVFLHEPRSLSEIKEGNATNIEQS